MPLVTLGNGKSFRCEPSQTIIEAAAASGLVLEHSCKTGRCNSCEATVLKGQTEILIPELVQQIENSEDRILTCCRSAVSDLWLDLSDLGTRPLPKPIVTPCKIQEMKLVSNDVLQVSFRFPRSVNFEFVPGQYVNLRSPDGIERSYSIADGSSNQLLTLHVKRYSGGEMSEYLFREASTGDLLRIEGPFGTFGLREDGARHVIFVATGTGIAPISSILNLNRRELSDKTVSVVWGGRQYKDLYMPVNKIEAVDNYWPVLSRDKHSDCSFGYVQDVLTKKIDDFSGVSVYACGSPAMLESCLARLSALGLQHQNFYSDAFVESNKVIEI